MTASEAKDELHRYLRMGREALLWKLDGLDDYDIRRPLVPTGTNLLGLLKHLALVEWGYFALTFDRPMADPPSWLDDEEPNADMWATADETREQIIEAYGQVCAHSDETITALDLDAPGQVPWWPQARREVSLHLILVHAIAETHRHAGHADIVRELVDGSAGLRAQNSNLPEADHTWWQTHRERLEDAAQKFRQH